MSKLRELSALVRMTICLVLFCFLWVLISGQSVSAESTGGDWSWINSTPVLYADDELETFSPSSCTGIYESVPVYMEFGNQMVCYHKGTIQFGHYYTQGYYQTVVRYPLDSRFYRILTGCTYMRDCIYMPGSDTMAVRENRINGWIKSLVLYKNVSKRISLTPGSIGQFSYRMDLSNPDYIFQNSSGYAWPIGSMAASENGQWLAVELRERGIGIMNMNTFEMKRVWSTGIMYGYGYDPTTELAVSNNGQQVVQMGINSGITMIDSSSGCGDIVNDSNILQNYLTNPCYQVPIIQLNFIENFSTAVMPHFRNDGAELTFFAWSYRHPTIKARQVTVRASGFNPQRVDYLAMGDSYTSGEGETDDKYYLPGTNEEFEKCHVSVRSYPFLLSALSGIEPQYMKSVACSGAKTIDFYGNEDIYFGQDDRLISKYSNDDGAVEMSQQDSLYSFIQGRIFQNDFVDYYKPKIITIGVGGNDIDLVGVVTKCFGTGTCEDVGDPIEKASYAKTIKEFYPKLVATYKDVIAKSPSSKVFVIGYPRMIDYAGVCNPALSAMLDYDERRFLDEAMRYLNQVTEAAAKTVGIKFIDIYQSFGNRVICSEGDSAANIIRFGDDSNPVVFLNAIKVLGNESFHPNPTGHSLTADYIQSQIGNLSSASVCSDGRILCPVATPVPEPSAYWNLTEYENRGLATETKIYFLDKLEEMFGPIILRIRLAAGYVMSNMSVSISIHSNEVALGEYVTSSDGSLDVSVNLPDNFEAGYHEVHIVGFSHSGEPIDIYQPLLIREKVEVKTPETITPIVNSTTENNTMQSNSENNLATDKKSDERVAVADDLFAQSETGFGDAESLLQNPINQITKTPQVKGDEVISNRNFNIVPIVAVILLVIACILFLIRFV